MEVAFQDRRHAEWALWQLAPDAEVPAPRWLRDSLHARAAAIAARYGAPLPDPSADKLRTTRRHALSPHRPKATYVPYERFRPARREHAPDAAPDGQTSPGAALAREDISLSGKRQSVCPMVMSSGKGVTPGTTVP
ncbi:hypothetical protein ACFWFZ_12435 [Streptomyces sp. NPDC060232]|uniref:hypothetical protein n=1 Tax=Streptomyces sp. NPDC060232 TaxID=3347079 RepID=UPI0036601636